MGIDLDLWKSVLSPTGVGRRHGTECTPPPPHPSPALVPHEKAQGGQVGSQTSSSPSLMSSSRTGSLKNKSTNSRILLWRRDPSCHSLLRARLGGGGSGVHFRNLQRKSSQESMQCTGEHPAGHWTSYSPHPVVFPKTIPPPGSAKTSLSFFARKESKYFSMIFSDQLNTVSL